MEERASLLANPSDGDEEPERSSSLSVNSGAAPTVAVTPNAKKRAKRLQQDAPLSPAATTTVKGSASLHSPNFPPVTTDAHPLDHR